MGNERPATPRECLEARAKFGQALEDPKAEREVFAHAGGCLECMDAFLELKDTVKKLNQAAEALPETKTFSALIFDAIDRESRRRKNHRFHSAVAIAIFLTGAAALTLALVFLPSSTPSRETRSPDAPAENATQDKRANMADEAGPPEEEGKDDQAAETRKKPEEKAKTDPVEEILKEIHRLENEPPPHAGPGERRRFRTLRATMDRARLLEPEALDRLIKHLEEGKRAPGFRGRAKLREAVVKRLKLLRDTEFRPRRPRPPPRKKK